MIDTGAMAKGEVDLESLYGEFFRHTKDARPSGWRITFVDPPKLPRDGHISRLVEVERIWRSFDLWARRQAEAMKLH